MNKEKKSHYLFFLLLTSCFLLLYVSACNKVEKTSIDQPISQQEEDVYKIAVAAPQFGPYKELGLSIVRGAELAVELKNKNGGINGKKIKLIKIDDGGLSGEATWRAKSLVQEKVLGVIGHLNSDISIPASEIYAKAMIAEISPGSTSPLFTERKSVSGYVFRTVGRDDQQGEISAKYALEKNFKKIAVLYNNRIYGLSLSSEFIKRINESMQGVEIVYHQMYKVGNNDFSKEVSAIKEKSADLIFFAGEYSDAAKLLSQIKKAELNISFLGGEAVFDQELIAGAKGSSEGAYVISLPTITDNDFIRNYKTKFNKELGAYSANSFDATNILISAIESVKDKNPEKIAKNISQIKNFPGLTGKFTFDSKGDLLEPRFSVYQVKNGMFVVLQ